MKRVVHYVYATPPIDYWDGFTEVAEADDYVARGLTPEHEEELGGSMRQALSLLRERTIWEGDGTVRCSGIPTSGVYTELLWAVKQENNGSVFIVSPIELPGLEQWRH